MAYNNSGQNYYGGLYGSNYNLGSMPQMSQMPQYQQPINNYNQNYLMGASRLDGFPSYFVDSYEQVRQASVASDGTPSIFISNVEDRFWLKKTNTENGRTVVKTFTFQEDTEEQTKGNSTILGTPIQQEQEYVKREDLNNLLTPLFNEMQMIKDTIFANTSPSSTQNNSNNNGNKKPDKQQLSDNKLKISK